MKLNSFQKNGFLNVGNQTGQQVQNNSFDNNIQNIRDRMWQAKSDQFAKENVQESCNSNQSNRTVDYQQRVESLKNMNRWKG